jgi:acyl-coenzyme A synthetase/AMP-(fatty) acid ligase
MTNLGALTAAPPREVEEVRHEHPAVAEVAVIPHPELGKEVGAAVALKPGAGATTDELRAFARDRWRRTSTRGTSGW